ncbi:SigE family RNA polymerase sigma factor [Flexivirga oryzae]|uniref:RNA polymerase sigma-70 factor (Sigma-E family) n=1 Tax=Flexivirga oryzae TaxID=1794944 RepID=A0A839NGI3_9MICO|nr:RNA polymerase sigma-70 factor (sigma-E family) [Flexivirga oryzae]
MTTSDFASFVERETAGLRKLATSLTGNRTDADDLLQETFTKTFVSWRKVRSATAPSAYVRRMMVHTFLSGRRRRASSEIVSPFDNDELTSPDPAEAYVQHHALLAQVRRLPERQRAIVVLRFMEDLPVGEVASIMRMREGAVRTACHRALAELREAAAANTDLGDSRATRTQSSYAI